MNRCITFLSVSALVCFTFLNVSAQLIGSTANVQTPLQDIRKGSIVQYSIPAGSAGEQYSWEITGGTPTPAASSGSGSAADPYIINFSADLTSITVQWNTDASTITGITGRIRVQKKTGGCVSLIQSLDLNAWSNPTAAISDADYEMCSGDATPGIVTVQFTGSPNFDLKYTVKDLDGTIGAEQTITSVTGASTTIPLPSNLINTSTTSDQTYEITITQMNDAFQGDGLIADGTFKITVHAAINTGAIVASPASLQHR